MATSIIPPQAPEVEQGQDAKGDQQHAPRYQVLLHNDDVTPMDFVVVVLRSVFQKPEHEGVHIMLTAHYWQIAHVATLPLEQAEFRVGQAHRLARARNYPLRLTYEAEK